MARPRTNKQEEIVVALTPVQKPVQTINKEYMFIERHKCTINNRPFNVQLGDIVELTDFEASVLKNFVEPV
jgi:hypothetical protein